MSKIFKKISKGFNKFSQKLGDALQNEETAQNEESVQDAPVDEKQEQNVEADEPQQKEEPTSREPDPIKKEAAKEPVPPKEEPKMLDDKESLLRNVVSTLAKRVEFKNAMNGKKLVVWLDCDRLTFSAYDTDSYRQQMLSTLLNEKGFEFEQVAFSLGKPALELHATKIGDNDLEYLQVIEEEKVPEQVSCKAVISVFGEAGSLAQDKYILSSEDMKEKMITCYNIGAGKFPKIPTGYRENHIAIDDNPDSPMVEKNKFVSRMHAHIGFSDKFGFYFQVEKDGTRLLGKRTRIFRGEETIECENPEVKIPLQDGDLIELGKAVVLRYKQLKEE